MKLSLEAKEFLLDNGYYFKENDDQVLFKPSKFIGRTLIVIMIVIMLFWLILGSGLHPVFPALPLGLGLVVLTYLVFVGPIRRSLNKPPIVINMKERIISYQNESVSFDWVKTLKSKSKFIAEYTSAFKTTNQEFEIKLQLVDHNQVRLLILTFTSDYKEPCEYIKEIARYIFLVINSAPLVKR